MSDIYKSWIKSAENDYNSALVLLNHEKPILDTASYHCQQSIEKYLKGSSKI